MTSLTTVSSMATNSYIPPVNSERSPSSDYPQVQSARPTSNTAKRDEIAQSISNEIAQTISNLTFHLTQKEGEAEALQEVFMNGSNDNTVERNARWKTKMNLDAINLYDSVGELVQKTKNFIGQVQNEEAKTFENQLRDLAQNAIDTNCKVLEVVVKVLGSDSRELQISNATSSISLAVNSPQETAAESIARWKAETKAQVISETVLDTEANSRNPRMSSSSSLTNNLSPFFAPEPQVKSGPTREKITDDITALATTSNVLKKNASDLAEKIEKSCKLKDETKEGKIWWEKGKTQDAKKLGENVKVLEIKTRVLRKEIGEMHVEETFKKPLGTLETEVLDTKEKALKVEAQALGFKLWELKFLKSMQVLPQDSLSNAKPKEAVVTDLEWGVILDFAKKQLECTARYQYDNKFKGDEMLDPHDNNFKGHETLTLDASDLDIDYIEVNGHRLQPMPTIEPSNRANKPDMLCIPIPPNTKNGDVKIKYRTSAQSPAVHWVDKKHTEGKQHPQVYTLFMETAGASVIPGQHSPQVRLTYKVNITTKSPDLMALSSVTNNPTERNSDGEGEYKDLIMERKVPLCFLNLQVGNFTFQESHVDSRVGVYAENALANRSNAFAKLPEFMRTAEEICGPTTSGRYNPVVVSGGIPDMAPVHPCASLYSSACLNNPYAVGHHLFHFWAGSGIPTPIRNHSFLSEGLHTYLEYQFSEKTWGTDYASKLFLTKLREMERDMQAHQETSPDVLKLCQATDERKNTKIPSAKGALFFFMLEQAFCKIIKIDGKEQFHRFLKDYMRVFEQESTSKDRFNKFLETWLENEIGSHVNFLLLCNDNNWWNWFYGTEIPENAPTQFQTGGRFSH